MGRWWGFLDVANFRAISGGIVEKEESAMISGQSSFYGCGRYEDIYCATWRTMPVKWNKRVLAARATFVGESQASVRRDAQSVIWTCVPRTARAHRPWRRLPAMLCMELMPEEITANREKWIHGFDDLFGLPSSVHSYLTKETARGWRTLCRRNRCTTILYVHPVPRVEVRGSSRKALCCLVLP
jgi:hypothetical protein